MLECTYAIENLHPEVLDAFFAVYKTAAKIIYDDTSERVSEFIKVSIQEIGKDLEEEILIRCHEVNDKVHEIVDKLKMESFTLLGYHDDRVHRIKLTDIYYFEAVDGKVFTYCKDNVFEVKFFDYTLKGIRHFTSEATYGSR